MAWAARNPEIGYAQGMNQVAAVFLKLGFEDESCFWMLARVLEELIPGCHAPDLHGLFRDTAVADVLVQTFLPAHAAAFVNAEIQLLWLTADFFLTMGAKNASLPLIVRLWDFSFLHGARGLFSGLLAHLELFFPVPTEGKSVDSEDLIRTYRKASRNGDPEQFASRLHYFLHERQGGVSDELIAGLRSALGQPKICFETLPAHVLAQGRQMNMWFLQRAMMASEVSECGAQEALLKQMRCPMPLDAMPLLDTRSRSAGFMYEDAACHEAWQDAVEVAGSVVAIDMRSLDELLLQGRGMPLKYRHKCWPAWLQLHAFDCHAVWKDRETSCAQTEVSDDVKQEIAEDVAEVPEDVLPVSQRDSLCNLLALLAARVAGGGYARGLSHVAAVFLKLGFAEEDALEMLSTTLGWLTPGGHVANLHGLFRDIAVADVLVHTCLPLHATAMSVMGIPLLWLAADFFLSLGCKEAPLPVSARLLDLCLLHGPPALFCGFLATLELYLPLPSGSVGVSREVTEVVASYRENCRKADADVFINLLVKFLRERHGGITAELIEGLREAVVERDAASPSTHLDSEIVEEPVSLAVLSPCSSSSSP